MPAEVGTPCACANARPSRDERRFHAGTSTRTSPAARRPRELAPVVDERVRLEMGVRVDEGPASRAPVSHPSAVGLQAREQRRGLADPPGARAAPQATSSRERGPPLPSAAYGYA